MPPISINAIEAFWIGVNSFACLVTTLALWDAWADRRAIKALNGRAREIAAAGNVRREVLRLIVQNCLLFLVIPSALDDSDIDLTFFVSLLIIIAVVLLVATLFDLRDRKRLIGIVASDIEGERRKAMQRIEQQGTDLAAAMQANTAISQQASDHADAAYHEANSVNLRIAAQGTEMKGVAGRLQSTSDETAEKVEDIHQVVIENAPTAEPTD